MNLKYIPENIFLVGGTVRDFLLKKKINDFDFVLMTHENVFKDEASSFLKKNFNKTGFLIGKVYPPTIRVVLTTGEHIDITLMTGDFKEDALRRDFTINAIYSDLNFKKIIDPLNGKHDIVNKKIKVTSDKSFSDDPLRLLRAVRFLGQLDDFTISKDTYNQILNNKKLIIKVSVERIREELEKIFLNRKRFILLKHLQKTGLLFEIFPEMKLIDGLEQKKFHKYDTLNHSLNILRYFKDDFSDEDKIIYSYVALFHDLGKYEDSYTHMKHSVELAKKILSRLKMPKRKSNTILDIIENHMRILQISLNKIKENTLKKLVFYHYDIIDYLINFAIMESYTKYGDNSKILEVCNRLKEFKKNYETKKELFETISGKNLLKLGIEQGSIIGEILTEIKYQIFRDDLKNQEDIFKRLDEIIKQKRVF